jgi:hypothetical protein
MTITYIEDLLLYIVDPINGFKEPFEDKRDKSFLLSLANQIKKPLAFTKKQSDLLIKILSSKQELFNKIENLDNILSAPVFKFQFRVVDNSRKMYITQYENKKVLCVKSGFDHKITNALMSIEHSYYMKDIKGFFISISEKHIEEIVDKLKDFDFQIEHQIMQWYEEIKNIRNNSLDYLPTLTYDVSYHLKNANSNMLNYFNSTFNNTYLSAMFLSRTLGLSIDKSVIDEVESHYIDDITRKLIFSGNQKIKVSTKKIDLAKSLKNIDQYPVLVLMPDRVQNSLTEWYNAFNSVGINSEEMSVLFRRQNDKPFNEFVKDNNLNNFVTDKTKIVFVKHKLPKILYKIDFKPKIVITTSEFFAHFSNQKLIDSHPFVVYYQNED